MQERKHNSKPLFLNGTAATPAKTNNKKFWEFRNAADTGGTAELLLYGYISETSWMGDEVTPKEFAADLATIPATEDLTVRICSGGGDVWAAQAIGALLENRIGTVTAQIEGICASAATIVASHCKVVKAAEDATYMIQTSNMDRPASDREVAERGHETQGHCQQIAGAYLHGVQ